MVADDELRRPELTLRQAAEACGVARITIRRRLDDGQFPNAYKNQDRQPQWLIPVEDLIAAGLQPNAYSNETPPVVDERGAEERLRDELSQARDQITRLRHERELAVALADERERALADLRSAMRMLEAPRPVIVEVPRRRWFRRNKPATVEVAPAPVGNTEDV